MLLSWPAFSTVTNLKSVCAIFAFIFLLHQDTHKRSVYIPHYDICVSHLAEAWEARLLARTLFANCPCRVVLRAAAFKDFPMIVGKGDRWFPVREVADVIEFVRTPSSRRLVDRKYAVK